MVTANAQLQAIADALNEARARVVAYGQHPDRLFRQRPAPNAWSAAECIRHLTLTTQAFLPILDDGISRAGARQGHADRRYRRDLLGWLLTWALEPPVRTKTKTTAAFVPGADAGTADVVGEFVAVQEALLERLARANGRDLEGVKVVSPFNARVSYNLYATFTILAAHERRHLWQADRALASVATTAGEH